MVGQEIIEVLYSPIKAFRKIIEKPDFKRVLIVLLLVISVTVGLQYVYNTKQFFENRNPQNDDWTETISNQHNWTASQSVSLDLLKHQNGNSSIIAFANQTTEIWLKITDIKSINCLNETGFKELLFSINWNNNLGLDKSSALLKLFSENEQKYFEKNLSDDLPSIGQWEDITLNFTDQGWNSINNPEWENITGLEFSLEVPESANITLNIDNLFFRNYISPIEATGLETALLFIFFSVTFSVGTNWVLWAGILVIVSKLFAEDLGKWNVFFVIIGHAFLATFVYTIISTIFFTSLPVLYMPLDPNLQVNAFSETWLPNLAYQAGTIILWVGEVWIAALSTIVIRQLKETTWGKAATISVIAFGLRFILRFFFGL